ncbi:unnamed protein product, partial [Ectocarpus sp. 12 AP-2014]
VFGTLKKLFEDPAGDPDHSPEQARRLASAALLMEVARADFTQDAVEEQAMANLLANTLELSEDDVALLMKTADEAVDGATSLYEFTSLVNDHYSYDDKRSLVQNMWQVAFADASLDKYEEHLIRRVAELIYLNHEDFIRTKQVARTAAEQFSG